MAESKPNTKSKIQNLKAVIKRRGLSRPNLFEIDLSGLQSKGLGALGIASTDEIRDLQTLITKATLPTRNLVSFEHSLYRNNTSFVSGYVNSGFTAEFTLTEDYLAKRVFNKWLNTVINQARYIVGYKSGYVCDIEIRQLNLDKENTIAYSAKLINCFPKGVNEINLDSGAAGLPSIDVEFLYDDIIFEEDPASRQYTNLNGDARSQLFGPGLPEFL